MGPGFGAHEIADAVERVVESLSARSAGPANASWTPIAALGMEPFKNVAYQEQMNAAYNG